MSEEEGFFKIPFQSVTRDDIRSQLKKGKNELSDAVLSDVFMQEVANKMGKALVNEGWWETLELAVEMVWDDFGIDIEKGVKCSNCGAYDIDWISTNTNEDQSIMIEIKTFYCNSCDKYFNIEV